MALVLGWLRWAGIAAGRAASKSINFPDSSAYSCRRRSCNCLKVLRTKLVPFREYEVWTQQPKRRRCNRITFRRNKWINRSTSTDMILRAEALHCLRKICTAIKWRNWFGYQVWRNLDCWNVRTFVVHYRHFTLKIELWLLAIIDLSTSKWNQFEIHTQNAHDWFIFRQFRVQQCETCSLSEFLRTL